MNNTYGEAKGRYEIQEVRIEDIDKAVNDYFDKKLDIHVSSNKDNNKKVPVIFATGERWKMIRDKRGIRDVNKTLILPLITIQRTDIDRTPGFGGMALEVPSIVVSKKIHPETTILQNLIQVRKNNGFVVPSKEDKVIYDVLTLPFPDFAVAHYQILVWTQYMQQMNETLEKIFFSYDYMDSFVLPMNYDQSVKDPKGKGYYFVGFRDSPVLSSQSNFEEFTDEERIIRYQYDIKIPIYLLLNPKDMPVVYGRMKSKKEKWEIIHQQTSFPEISFEESDSET